MEAGVGDNPPNKVATPVLTAEAIACAQQAAAKGGWPRAATCSLGRRKTFWAWTVATFFGAGFGKPGPGTWGSVAATLIWAAVAWLAHPPGFGMLWLTLGGVALSIAFGVPAATIAARESGRKDPGFVVIDEVAGVWITLLPLCFVGAASGVGSGWKLASGLWDWKHVLAALLLFRVFDIAKPAPVRQLEQLPEGWGIVFDDVAAGLYAGAVLWLAVAGLHWK